MKTRQAEPTPDLMAFRADMLAVLDKHAGKLPADHMLSLAAHMVGQIVAMQDQRVMTPADAIDLVKKNMERGNREAARGIHKPAVEGAAR